MRNPMIALALAASALFCGPAAAQAQMPPPGGGAPMGGPGGMGIMGALMRADANHDGIVTREEVIASSDQMFDRLDTNRDGTVSPDEMAAARQTMRPNGATPPPPGGAMQPPPGGRAMARSFTRAQWHDRALAQFDRVDANHDGRVDQAEMQAYRDAMRDRRQDRRGGDMPPPPPPAPPAGQ